MEFMDTLLYIGFPVVMICLIMFGMPVSLETENKKRAAKGKPELTEDEFQKKVKKERLIGVIIIVAGMILAQVIVALAETFGGGG